MLKYKGQFIFSSHLVNTIDMAMQEARSSAAVVFTKFSQNIMFLAPECLTLYMLKILFWRNVLMQLQLMFYTTQAEGLRGIVLSRLDLGRQGPVLLMLLRHVARILANGRAAFFESCDAIGWNSCDVSQKR